MIQGDISKCFDNIPHDIIRREINKTIACPNMKALINKIIAYPYVDPNGNVVKSKIGTPQGTICSPILANIVLHQLDCFMEEYAKNFKEGYLRGHNPQYLKFQSLRKKARLAGDRKLAIKYLVQMRKITSHNPMDKYFRRLMFIRYADDFLILTISSYEECCTIKEKIFEFLLNNCGLTLNKDKTLITPTKKHYKFLGHDIVNNPTKDYVVFDKGINT